MANISRRAFLGGAAVAAGAAGLELLPRPMRKVLATPATPLESLEQIEHVVIFMQENRSFDTYFGTMSGVRGFDDPKALTLTNGRSVFYQPDTLNPAGYDLPFHLDTTTTSAAAVADLSNAWTAQHAAWSNGKMDSWVSAQRAAQGSTGPLTMGYYTRQDLPFHYALADAFTVCDAYHCSVFGSTNPNRLYLWTGTVDPAGTHGGPVVDNSETPPYTWTTYPERLQAAGISWRVYQGTSNFDDNALDWFAQYQQAPTTSPLYINGIQKPSKTAFIDDVANDSLPQVSWIISNGTDSEHPSFLPANGAAFIYQLMEALASNPKVWNKTVFFLNYDENDGFFDHVPPPVPPPGTPGEYITAPLPASAGGIAGPIGLGFRVPMVVISPWSRGGWVCSDTFDHTSTIRFIERRFGVMEPNISAWRRQVCGDLTSTLRQGQPDRPFPTLVNPSANVLLEEQEASNLPAPQIPAVQAPAVQEPSGAALVNLQVSVSEGIVPGGQHATVTAIISNATGPQTADQSFPGPESANLRPRPIQAQTLKDLAMTLNLPTGWTEQATSKTEFAAFPPNQSARVTWQLTAPTQPTAGSTLFPTVKATYHVNNVTASLEQPVFASAPISITAAYNNTGIGLDGTNDANFDADQDSYSEQALTAAGLAPGTPVTSGGVQYLMPNVAAAQPDNVQVFGQTILAPNLPGATVLGFLGAADDGDTSGTVTITYTDGTTQSATITFSDWTLGGGTSPLQPGNVIVASSAYRDNGATLQHQTTYVFATVPIKLQAGKTIKWVGLPATVSGGTIHVFSIGTDKGVFS